MGGPRRPLCTAARSARNRGSSTRSSSTGAATSPTPRGRSNGLPSSSTVAIRTCAERCTTTTRRGATISRAPTGCGSALPRALTRRDDRTFRQVGRPRRTLTPGTADVAHREQAQYQAGCTWAFTSRGRPTPAGAAARCPSVVSRPWPGSTSRSAGRVKSRRSIEAMIWSKLAPSKRVLPGPPGKSVSPVKSSGSPSSRNDVEPGCGRECGSPAAGGRRPR